MRIEYVVGLTVRIGGVEITPQTLFCISYPEMVQVYNAYAKVSNAVVISEQDTTEFDAWCGVLKYDSKGKVADSLFVADTTLASPLWAPESDAIAVAFIDSPVPGYCQARIENHGHPESEHEYELGYCVHCGQPVVRGEGDFSSVENSPNPKATEQRNGQCSWCGETFDTWTANSTVCPPCTEESKAE